MKTIIFMNQKGGVGKSTIAYNVAIDLADTLNKKVLLLDTDRQTTSNNIFKRRTKPTCLKCDSYDNVMDIASIVQTAKTSLDFLIIDTAGIKNLELFNVIKKLDALAIIPTTLNIDDIDSTVEVLKFVHSLNLNYRVLLNMVEPSTKIEQQNILKQLEDLNIKCLETFIRRLAVHRKAIELGLSSNEYKHNSEFLNVACFLASI